MDELALVHPSLICSDRIEDYRARIRLADAAVLLVGGLDGAVWPRLAGVAPAEIKAGYLPGWSSAGQHLPLCQGGG
jgi:hypothetical protein